MKNGHEKRRPKDPALKAAGVWIYSAPSLHGSHRIYYWMRKDDCGADHFSAAGAEAEARRTVVDGIT